MRRSSNNQPTLEERIESDPALAAEMAALRFESDYQHKWSREHSFVYRHFCWFVSAGIALFMIPAFALIFLSGVVDFSSPSGVPWMVTLLGVGYAGILLTLFTFARSVSTKWYTAWIVAISTFVGTLVIGALALLGTGALVFAIV